MPDERQLRITTSLDATGIRAGMAEAQQAVADGAAKMSDSMGQAASSTTLLAEAQARLKAELAAQREVMAQYPGMADLIAEANQRVAAATAEVTAVQKQAAASAAQVAGADVGLGAAEDTAAAATLRHADALGTLRPRLSANSSGIRANISGYGNLATIAAVAGAAMIVHVADSAATTTVALADLAAAAKVSVSALASLQAAFNESGVSGEQFRAAIGHLLEQEQQLNNGSRETVAAFMQLNIPLESVMDGSMSVVQVLQAMSEKLHSAGSSAGDLQAATYLLGSSQLNLLGTLRQGPEALDQLASKYGALGDATARSVDDARQLTAAEGELKAVWDELSLKAIPGLTGAMEMALHPLLLAKSMFLDGSNAAAQFALELAQAKEAASDWSGGASVFGGPQPTNQSLIDAEARLTAEIETADAVGRSHVVTLAAHRAEIERLAAALGTEATPAVQRYANQLADADKTSTSKNLADDEKVWRTVNSAIASAGEQARRYYAEQQAAVENDAREFMKAQQEKIAANKETIADLSGAIAAYNAQQERDIEANTQLAIGAIRQQASEHKITGQQELSDMQRIYQQEYAAEVALLNAELAALDPHDKDYLSKRQTLNNQIEQAANKLALQLQQAQAQASRTDRTTAWAEDWKREIRSVSREWETSVRGILTGSETMGNALRSMMAQYSAFAIEELVKVAARWVFNHGLKEAMVAAEQALGITSAATQKALAASVVTTDAGEAAAGAYAATAAIPIIGPVLAPAAAAQALSATLAFGVFEQGGIVPSTGLHFLHQREMVLPERISTAVQQMAAGGGGAGGDVHIHMPAVSAMDSSGVEEVLQRHGRAIGKIVRAQIRSGALSR